MPFSLTRPSGSTAAAASTSAPSASGASGSSPAIAACPHQPQQNTHASHPHLSQQHQHQQPQPHGTRTPDAEDPLVSNLRHALQSLNHSLSTAAIPGPSYASSSSSSATTGATAATHHPHPHRPSSSVDGQMPFGKEKDTRPRIEIVLDPESDPVFLRGSGASVEPSRLSGNVVLYLAESTSIKEITLQFKGKARIPFISHDSLARNLSTMTYSICSHDWSFLEGERKHSHTLKAGRHVFPFQLQIGGSLPSSVLASVPGVHHASLRYKLRAHASRPGLSHNLQCTVPVTILRTFASEALEYQQTLEIENTWPQKLMYSIMIPHKAWAVGDSVTALLKFSPLAKGVRVLNIVTHLIETVKMFNGSKAGTKEEHTRIASQTKHEIVDGLAVCVYGTEHSHGGSGPTSPHGHAPTASTSTGGTATSSTTAVDTRPPLSRGNSGPHHIEPTGSGTSPNVPDSSTHVPGTASSVNALTNSLSDSLSPSASWPSSSSSDAYEEVQEPSTDIVTTVSIDIPRSCAPSHSLDPIAVSHRIRWFILIANPDGHTSELRCSLPLSVLDGRLLVEARANTMETRRLLLGDYIGEDSSLLGADHQHRGADGEEDGQDSRSQQLPSYSSHFRDRVANQYFPSSMAVRVYNPWVNCGFSPTIATSGWNTPQEPGTLAMTMTAPGSHLPNRPPPHDSVSSPLEWINSELLMSLHSDHTTTGEAHTHTPGTRPSEFTPPELLSTPASSRGQSRRPTRPPSPAPVERHSPPLNVTAGMPNEIFVHGESQASRIMGKILAPTIKSISSIAHHSWHFPSSHNKSSSAQSQPQLPSLPTLPSSLSNIPATAANHQHPIAPYPPSPYATTTTHNGVATPDSTHSTLSDVYHRAFTEVPDYGVAARGFIGGVPPLEFMQGLPSYDQAAESERLSPHQVGEGMRFDVRRESPVAST